MPVNASDFGDYPLPGTSTLYYLDYIVINTTPIPLDGMPEGGKVLDIEKRKSPGSDYSSYVSHGIDTTPIKIKLMLFYDLTSKKDWWTNYNAIKQFLCAPKLDERYAIPVFHPFLDDAGINSLIFVGTPMPQQKRGQIFTVSLEAYNPVGLRVGSGKSNSSVQDTKTIAEPPAQNQSSGVANHNQSTAAPTARASSKNYRGPAANNAGKLPPSQR